MRIISSSDWHIGKDSWKNSEGKDFGLCVAEKIHSEAAKDPTEAFIFGGDLAETPEGFKQGLEKIAQLPIEHKLFYLGNNDIERLGDMRELEGVFLTYHHQPLSQLLGYYNIHLLDTEPKTIGGIGFVGNMGCYDGSLWKPTPSLPEESTFEKARAFAMELFRKDYTKEFCPEGLNYDTLLNYEFGRIKSHMDQLVINPDVEKIVLGIHHVPSRDFVIYKENPLTQFDQFWNHLNFHMGSEKFARLYNQPKVRIGLTGHTHRSDNYPVEGIRVYNVSATKEKPFQRFEII